MQLKESQQIAEDKVFELFEQGHSKVVLMGSAGTGKTVVTSSIVEKVKKNKTINKYYNNGHTYVCAPTNKALAVIQGKIKANVTFETIHKALRISPYTDRNTGVQHFVQKKIYGKPKGD